MSVNITIGDKVPVFLNVGNKNEALFVRAIVTNHLGANIPESPIALISHGNGLYGFDDLIMPDVQFLNIVYDVFKDDTFSTPAKYYSVTESFVVLSSSNTNNTSLINDMEVEVVVDSETAELDVLVGKK